MQFIDRSPSFKVVPRFFYAECFFLTLNHGYHKNKNVNEKSKLGYSLDFLLQLNYKGIVWVLRKAYVYERDKVLTIDY